MSVQLSEREEQVRTLHGRLNPTFVKGLKVTETERQALLARINALNLEVENAPVYAGVLGD